MSFKGSYKVKRQQMLSDVSLCDCCGSSLPLCSSLITLVVLPSGQTKQESHSSNPDGYGKRGERGGPQPLNHIIALRYL